MKILTVIPIAKGIPRDELSYFSAKNVPLGTVITAPFGKRTIKGVVIDQHEVRELKSSIKASNFALRNITEVHDQLIPEGLFAAAQKTALMYAQPTGTVLKTMIPDQIFEYYLKTPPVQPVLNRLHPDVQGIQLPTRERISYYKTLARENLARHVSTLIIVPTLSSAEYLYESMKTGIEEKIFIAHSKKTKKQIEQLLKQIVTEKKPCLFIATAPFACMVRSDWDTLVIEQSSSSYYRYEFGPIFDMRYFIEEIARWCGTRLIYADTLLSTDIRMRMKEHTLTDLRSTWHITKPDTCEIISMKDEQQKSGFRMLHEKTLSFIHQGINREESILLLTTRKGLAPLTVCSDCGTVVRCPNCETPLVLHKKNPKDQTGESRIYLCHHCMRSTQPLDHCTNCQSWKLKPLGISTESLEQEIKEQLPSAHIFIADGDTQRTAAAITNLLNQWRKSSGGILIATPFILPYLGQVGYGALVSMDSLLSLPSYRSSEQTLSFALSFLEKVTSEAIIQTRNMDHDVIRALNTENLFDFMKEELDTRIQFGYPPAKILLKVSLELPKTEAKSCVEFLEKLFKPYDPDILMKRGLKSTTIIVQAVIKLEYTLWNNSESDIHRILETLDRPWKKEVNSDTIL